MENLHNSRASVPRGGKKCFIFFQWIFMVANKHGVGNAWEMLPHSEPAALVWAPEEGAASQKGTSPPALFSIAPNRQVPRWGSSRAIQGIAKAFALLLSEGVNLSFGTAPAAAMSVAARHQAGITHTESSQCGAEGKGDSRHLCLCDTRPPQASVCSRDGQYSPMAQSCSGAQQ